MNYFKIICRASEVVVAEEDEKLFFFRDTSFPSAVFIYVAALLAFICTGAGIALFAISGEAGGQRYAGAGILAGGLLLLFVTYKLMTLRKKKQQTLPGAEQRICIIDTRRKELLQGDGRRIAPLESVQMKRKMQITSSSPALFLEWPGGSLLLVRGNPFSGGTGPLEHLLKNNGVRASR